MKKIIPCKTLLNHELENSTMECRGQEVSYVEKQVLVSDIPSIEISENVCHSEETDGGCTITLSTKRERGHSLSHWKHM